VYDLASQTGSTECNGVMGQGTRILPGLPAVSGKPVHVAFDGGRLTSDAGILLLAAIEQRLKIAERLAACIEDPRAPERVEHGLSMAIKSHWSEEMRCFSDLVGRRTLVQLTHGLSTEDQDEVDVGVVGATV